MIDVKVDVGTKPFKILVVKDDYTRWNSGFLSQKSALELGEQLILAAYDLMGKHQLKKYCEENDLV